jgi:hypothetical protein
MPSSALSPSLLLLLTCGLGVAACALAPDPEPVRPYVLRVAALPASEGRRMFPSCSPTPRERGRRVRPTGYWQVGDSLVQAIEVELPRLLDSVLPAAPRTGWWKRGADSRHYVRQYMGYEVDGVRAVYVHGVIEGLVVRPEEVGRDTVPWRRSFLGWCDTGPGVFGIVYDPRLRRFGELEYSEALIIIED